MGEPVDRNIRQILDDTRAKGRDYLSQTEEVLRAGLQAKHNITNSGARTVSRCA